MVVFAKVDLLESVSIVLADLRGDVVCYGGAVDGEGYFACRKEGNCGLDCVELGQLSRGDGVAVNVQSGLPGQGLVRVLVL